MKDCKIMEKAFVTYTLVNSTVHSIVVMADVPIGLRPRDEVFNNLGALYKYLTNANIKNVDELAFKLIGIHKDSPNTIKYIPHGNSELIKRVRIGVVS